MSRKTSSEHLVKLNPNHDVSNLVKNQAEIRVILCKQNLKRRELLKQSKNKRTEYLRKIAEHYAKEHDIPKEAAVKQIAQSEASKRIYKNIRRALDKDASNSLSTLLVPNNGKDIAATYKALKDDRTEIQAWVEISNPRQVEKDMVEWCRLHFNQAAETPFATTKWETLLENEEIQNEILEGKSTVGTTESVEIQEFLRALRVPRENIRDKVGLQITYEEFEYWARSSKESKASSPSGLHRSYSKSEQKWGWTNVTSKKLVAMFV